MHYNIDSPKRDKFFYNRIGGKKMIAMREELFAAPEDEWRHVPFVVNRHKWWLRWYRRDDGGFFFAFVSPKKRSYSFFAERGKGGRGRVTDADVAIARGDMIASYCEV